MANQILFGDEKLNYIITSTPSFCLYLIIFKITKPWFRVGYLTSHRTNYLKFKLYICAKCLFYSSVTFWFLELECSEFVDTDKAMLSVTYF